MRNSERVLRALFWMYVAATFIHIAYVVNHEPFAFDAWNIAVDTDSKEFSVGRFFAFWKEMYTHSNPRIGQPMAYLAYKLGGVAEIGTPLAYLAIVLGAFVLGARRRPDLKNGRDLATLAVGIGVLWFASPNLPAYMFCRAYATNYIWAIAIQLWFVIPLRLHEATDPIRTGRLVGYAVLGVIAGMCNEHTGPTLILFTLGYALWSRRKHGRAHPVVWVGAIAPVIGYALIFFAPGQGQRYEGLGERYTLVQQIITRGFAGNIEIYAQYLQAAAPVFVLMLFAIAIGLLTDTRTADQLVESRARQRRLFALLGLCVVAGSLITITVFASPKTGPRFYLHAMALLMAPLLGSLVTFIERPRAFAPFVIVAVLASGYAAARTIPSYTHMADDSDRRLTELAATPPGGVYTIESFDTVSESWWALGDDARDQKKQEMIAEYFGLSRVLFRGDNSWATLGVTDVRLTMHYQLDRDVCLDEIDELALKPYIGREVGALHHAFLDAIAEIELVTKTKVKTIDLVATFLGPRPPLPRTKIFVAKWDHGVLEGYVARIGRVGRSPSRTVNVPDTLKQAPWEMYITSIGDQPRRMGLSTDAKLSYQPWHSGTYWVLACRADECFVVSAIKHSI